MERLMAAQSQQKGGDGSNFMMDFIKKAKKTFEINPKHPLIQGLLTKVEEAGEDDATASDELSQVIRVLWDTSLVRSGFTVPDTNSYFDQIELLLRKSLGVDESEKIDVGEIKPAPAVEEGPLDPRATETTSDDKPAGEDEKIQINSDGSTQKTDESKQDWAEWSKVKDQLKEKAIKDDQKEQKESKKEAEKEVKKESEKDDAEEDQLEAEELGEDDDGSADEADDFDFGKLGDMGDFDMEKMKEMMKDFGGFKDEL
jgi:heat shock protein beta